MRRRTVLTLLFVCWSLAGDAGRLQAAIPQTIHYQGRLAERDGTPLTGELTVTLRLYHDATDGAPIWEERHPLNLTRDDNGVFAVVLGSLTPFSSAVDFNVPLWITIEVDEQGEFSPRQPLSAAGYALNADRLDGMDSTELLAAARPSGTLLTAADTTPTFLAAGPGATVTRVGGTWQVAANAEHTHEGVQSLAASGQPALTGDAVLAAGSNIMLSQAGQTITIAAAGSGPSAQRATASATGALAIATGSDTELLTATITKSQAGSALLVLATVQLSHTGNPTSKSVDVKLFRDSTQLDASYTAQIGQANDTVRQLPVTVQAWDAPGVGTYTVRLKARASGNGAQATIRRLSIVELP